MAIERCRLREPRFGVLIENKDLLKIPLLLEEIPTQKQFRDAIESLSPEQQRFARAFRGMQLESTLFGVCVIQVKPQLETRALIRGSKAEVNIVLCPPSEWPMQPMRSGSTSGSDWSRSMARMLFQTAFMLPLW